VRSDSAVNNTLNIMGGNLARPLGTKSAKLQLQQDRSVAALDAARTESITSMAQSHQKLAASYEKKVDLKEIAELRETIRFLHDQEEAAVFVFIQSDYHLVKFLATNSCQCKGQLKIVAKTFGWNAICIGL
jgi:hypothetical protein